jgi:hypothetical protein
VKGERLGAQGPGRDFAPLVPVWVDPNRTSRKILLDSMVGVTGIEPASASPRLQDLRA